MAAQVYFHLLSFSTFILAVNGWRCAKYKHYFSQQPDYIECFWDCCGHSFDRHCCAPIGIIVGCGIVACVVLAALIVLLACWWHKRRASYQKGPKLFHNRRHSHYPVAPSSVTRPAPMAPEKQGPPGPNYGYPPSGQGQIYRPPQDRGYGPPQDRGYGPPPQDRGYRPPPQDRGYRPPPQDRGYGPPPQQGRGMRPPGPNEGGRSTQYADRPYRDHPEKPPKDEFFD